MAVVYTPIRLEIIPAILDGSTDAPLDKRQYLITIKAPVIHNATREQSLPSSVTLKLILGERLDLKLLPSDQTIPRGKYTVSYADAHDPSHPLSIEEWVVPHPPGPNRSIVSLNPTTLSYTLPEDFHSLIGIDLEPNAVIPAYTIFSNAIVFTTAPVAQTVFVNYIPILSRAQVVYLSSTWKEVPAPTRPSQTIETLTSY